MKSLLRIHRLVIALVVVALMAVPSAAQVTTFSPSLIDAVDQAIVQVDITVNSGGRTIRGSGSGIIIDSSGVILTAEHVVNRALSVEVVLHTGELYPARVVGEDHVYDIALVRVDAHRPLPTVSLGNSSLLQRGDPVMAFGRSPRRQAGPTSGSFMETDLEIRPGLPYLRTSAVVYPGDSGGALINDRGEVVGLIAALTRDGRVSLSVAVDAIKSDMNDLRAGIVRHPWIGIVGTTITDALVQELGLSMRSGVLILEVVEGSPAALAGLRGGRASSPGDVPRGGDVITAIDGRPMTTFGALAAYVLSKRIGDAVVLEFNRDGQVLTSAVVLAERPSL